MSNQVDRVVTLRGARSRIQEKTGGVEEARDVFQQQAQALQQAGERLGDSFEKALELILNAKGKIAFIGLGKSGLVANKMASTFASTGTPALFVHAAEAHHGDLGMISPGDVAVLVSASGETKEVIALTSHLDSIGVPSIALTGKNESTLARESTVVLDCSVEREACPNDLAPTTSSTVTMAMGDALSVCLIRKRQFSSEDFARLHPGGRLGKRLTARVRDVMRTQDLPCVDPNSTVEESLVVVNQGQLGLCLVMEDRKLLGLVTDGDLRRAMQRYEGLKCMPVSSIMTDYPVTVGQDELLRVARQRMQHMKLGALIAVDEQKRVVGVVDVFK